MKLFTYWWGVHLVAEDDEEVKLLYEMYRKLENPTNHEDAWKDIYEEGVVTLYLPYTNDNVQPEIKGEIVLEIAR